MQVSPLWTQQLTERRFWFWIGQNQSHFRWSYPKTPIPLDIRSLGNVQVIKSLPSSPSKPKSLSVHSPCISSELSFNFKQTLLYLRILKLMLIRKHSQPIKFMAFEMKADNYESSKPSLNFEGLIWTRFYLFHQKAPGLFMISSFSKDISSWNVTVTFPPLVALCQ